MSNYDAVKDMLKDYFFSQGIEFEIEIGLQEASKDVDNNVYLYDGTKQITTISMDMIAKTGYKKFRNSTKVINSADAFLVDKDNEWYLIEFKNSKIYGGTSKDKRLRDNVDMKGSFNLLMLMDIFSKIKSSYFEGDINFLEFARENISYILVCSNEKNPRLYEQIKAAELANSKYTPDFLVKLKDYFFKDAYVYNEDAFKRCFVKRFEY